MLNYIFYTISLVLMLLENMKKTLKNEKYTITNIYIMYIL